MITTIGPSRLPEFKKRMGAGPGETGGPARGTFTGVYRERL
jgi:hypothetical protein